MSDVGDHDGVVRRIGRDVSSLSGVSIDRVILVVALALAAALGGCGSKAPTPSPSEPFGVVNETATDAVVRMAGDAGTLNLLVPTGAWFRLPDRDRTSFGPLRAIYILAGDDCGVAFMASFSTSRGPADVGGGQSTAQQGGRFTIREPGIEPSFKEVRRDWSIAEATDRCASQPVPELAPPPAA